MKKNILTIGALALLPMYASADLLSVEIATGNWDRSPSGTFKSGVADTELTLSGTSGTSLGLKDEEEGYTYAVIRHAVPLVPNIKVMTTSFGHKGNNPAVNFTFEGDNYTGGVDSKFVLDHTDITAFWNMVDTGFTFDLGLTARQLDGEATVDDSRYLDNFGKSTTTIDGTIPMLYAGVAISPIENLRFSYEINWIGSGEDAISDSIAKISYHTDFMLGIEVGVRDMTIELDDADGNFADMTFDGSFVGVSFKF